MLNVLSSLLGLKGKIARRVRLLEMVALSV